MKFGWSRRNIPLQQFLIFITLWVRKYFIILKIMFPEQENNIFDHTEIVKKMSRSAL